MLLLRHLKSYLPAHSILRGFVALHLYDFAGAIRAGCAEAKSGLVLRDFQCVRVQSVRGVLRQRRLRLRRANNMLVQSVRGVLRQSTSARACVADAEVQSVRGVLRQSFAADKAASGCRVQSVRGVLRQRERPRLSRFWCRVQSVRGVLRQSSFPRCQRKSGTGAIRAGCAEAKNHSFSPYLFQP